MKKLLLMTVFAAALTGCGQNGQEEHCSTLPRERRAAHGGQHIGGAQNSPRCERAVQTTSMARALPQHRAPNLAGRRAQPLCNCELLRASGCDLSALLDAEGILRRRGR